MKDIFDLIEKAFGAGVLKTAAAAVVVYFLALGVFKLAEGLRTFSRHKRVVESEKASLEILKLRYEIEAIRKTHGLAEIAIVDTTANVEATPAVVVPLRGWRLLWRLAALLLSNIAFLSTVSAAFLITRYALAGYSLKPEEWGVTAAAAIVGLGSSYLSFWSLGPRIRQQSKLTFNVVWLLAGIVAVALFIWGFVEQNV